MDLSMKQQLKLTVLALALLQAPAWAAGEAIDQSRTVSATEKIEIENMRGEVRIVAVKGNKFSVKGTLDEKAEGYELTSEKGVTRFQVKMPRTIYGGWNSEKQEGSDLTIEVPVGSELKFSGVNANVSAVGVEGGAKLTTVNGAVSGEKLKGDIVLETVNGQINSVDNTGRLHLTTVNGEINDKGSSGSLEVESVNGEISLQSSAREVELEVVNGEGQLDLNGTERLEFSSVNGEIRAVLKNSKKPKVSASSVSGASRLTLDADVSARFDLEASAGGDIDNGLTGDKPTRDKYGPRRHLEFRTGSGEGNIEISTVSGEIELKKN